jgi:hypothetical protein
VGTQAENKTSSRRREGIFTVDEVLGIIIGVHVFIFSFEGPLGRYFIFAPRGSRGLQMWVICPN